MSSATSKPQIENRIREHVITLAGTIGERNVFRLQALGAARDYIEAIFEDRGYRVNRQEYEACDVICANLEATLPGASRPKQILLLGAHYDSVAGSPGANDNGSGVASLLEILRLFAGTSPVLPSASSPSSTRSRRFS